MKHFININVAGKIRNTEIVEDDPREAQRLIMEWMNVQLSDVLQVSRIGLALRVPVATSTVIAEPAPPIATVPPLAPVMPTPPRKPAPAKPAAKAVRK